MVFCRFHPTHPLDFNRAERVRHPRRRRHPHTAPTIGIVAISTNRNTMTFSGLTREPVIFQHTSTRLGLVQKPEPGDSGWEDHTVSLRCSAAAPSQPLLIRLSRFYAYLPLRKSPPRRRGGDSALPCQCLAAVLHVHCEGFALIGLGTSELASPIGRCFVSLNHDSISVEPFCLTKMRAAGAAVPFGR